MGDAAPNGLLILDQLATLVPLVIALVIPFIVEFFSKPTTNIHVRTVANALLATLAAAVATVSFTGGAADLGQYLINIVLAWIVTGRMYLTELPKKMNAVNSVGHGGNDNENRV